MAEEVERGTLLRTISADDVGKSPALLIYTDDGRSVRRISSNVAPLLLG